MKSLGENTDLTVTPMSLVVTNIGFISMYWHQISDVSILKMQNKPFIACPI